MAGDEADADGDGEHADGDRTHATDHGKHADGDDHGGFDPDFEGVSADEAFKVLGNASRIRILRALWEASETHLGFSELYRRSGVEDSGQFNYHLDKLVGHFVESTDDGYALTHAGGHVVRSVIAGTAMSSPTIEPVEVDASCPACGAPVAVRYESGFLIITCTNCEGFWRDRAHPAGTIGTLSFPPAALRNRTPLEALQAGSVYLVDRAETAMRGVCPGCAGRVEVALDLCADHDDSETVCDACGNPFIGVFVLTCETCKATSRAPSFAAVHHHPRVQSLYGDLGQGRRETTPRPGVVDDTSDGVDPWTWMWRGIDWPEEVLSHDPPRFRTVVEHDCERLVFEVDGSCIATLTD